MNSLEPVSLPSLYNLVILMPVAVGRFYKCLPSTDLFLGYVERVEVECGYY